MYDKDDSQDQQTIELLQTLKETPPRDADQAAQARKAFLSQAQQISNQPVSIPILERLISVFRPPKFQLRFSTLTIGLILSVFLLTISSSAYAARQSKPDQLFYTFKLWLENSRLSLTSRPDEKIDLHLVYAEERLKELTLEGSTYSDSGVERAMDNLSGHLEALRGLFDEDHEQNGRRERLNVILDQYEELGEREEDIEREEQEDDDLQNQNQASEDKEEDTEDQSETEDQDEESEDDSNKGKRRKESEASEHSQDSAEESEDGEDQEKETEPTEEPDETPDDDDPEEDPTKTPEPDDDD